MNINRFFPGLVGLEVVIYIVWRHNEQNNSIPRQQDKNLPESQVNSTTQFKNSPWTKSKKATHMNANNSTYSFDTAKKILFYTKFYGANVWPLSDGQDQFVKHKCPVSNCYMTQNRSLLPSVADFDALVFNVWHSNLFEIDENGKETGMLIPDKKDRRPNQRYVLYMGDTAIYHCIFNWTLSYRLNSDIPYAYGWIDPIGQPTRSRASDQKFKWIEYDNSNVLKKMNSDKAFSALAKRPYKIVWMTSHCDTLSRRMEYVEELKKHVGVKVVGACGEHCGVKGDGKCTDLMERDYKFYLAFENSFCEDYVSEKFWRTMSMNLVPIVMGGSHYDRIAPPHSYINALDFPNPKALADYILLLDKNPKDYLSYFWWKPYYSVRDKSYQNFTPWCELCRMLNNPNEPKKVFNEYDDMVKCWLPPWNKTDWESTK